MTSRYYKRFFVFIQIVAVFMLCLPAHAQERPAPEISTNTIKKQHVSADSYMAVTAHPLATQAAEYILAKGGSAADAGIAAQLVLGLVEPQSSGLGGGAFALYYDAATGALESWDARETAPRAANDTLFLNADGSKMDFYDAVIGGRSVGVPGTPALIHKLYKEHGALPAAQIFAPAIRMAQQGFEVTPRLAAMIEHDKGKLDRFAPARAYFYDADGAPLQQGDILRNEAYAMTLRGFRDGGRSYFYERLAPVIAQTVHDAGGHLSATDMAAYDVVERKPVCGEYRGYTVCGMGEPSSGGLSVLQILGMLERFDLGEGPNAQNLHLIAEASRLAFADRNEYMADPDFVDTPGEALIAPDYLKARSALIDMARRQDEVSAGVIDHEGGTSHISIVDSYGNILSMTTTIEGAFGSKLMVNGFLLNNELTDFNFETGTANSVAAGKRPRSSMAPTIVFDENRDPFLVIGSAGGSRIIGFVVQRIIAAIDWDMDTQESLAMPHVLARSDTVELETGLESMQTKLEAYGHKTKSGEMNSGLTAIMFEEGGVMKGAADPRREGIAAGQ